MKRLLACTVALIATACPHRVSVPDVTLITDSEATARVNAAAARRANLSGTVKGRLPGLEGVVMSADLDVAMEPPGKLSVAVRSFFEQPMQILATDGNVVTIFDATKGTPVFKRGAVNAQSVSQLLPIPLWPNELVSVFLARPAKANAHIVGVDEKEGTYDVWLDPPNSGPVQLRIRAADDAILTWRHFARDGRPLLDVTYTQLRAVGDAVVPFGWTLTLVDREPHQTLVFSATDVTWNGPPLPDEAFRLDPPENMPIEPL